MATQKQVKDTFVRFCSLYNLKTSAEHTPNGPEYYSNDYIKLDYNTCYGGYRMDIRHANTSQSFFSTMSRRSAGEMIAYLEGLIDAQQPLHFVGIVKEQTADSIK